MRSKFVAILACAGAMAACAPTIWDKPGATQAEFNRDSGRCRLLARGMNSGDFYAEGSPKFVAAAAVGNAVGPAINQQETYHDCMMAVGYSPRSSASAEADGGLYGAFARDDVGGKYGYSSNQHTPASADEAALRSCAAQTCKIVFRVGPRLCGAIAMNDNGKVWGGATRPARDVAEVAAMENCQKRTKLQCAVKGSECNR
ncbi:MAG: DUF4189 domain-containing protein [Alphaproteobacteria bacterium]|nr:DUF4189 domain-containing protein [Alphaproteobacteria bacterium]